jgi:hypothetical protein
MEKPKQPSVMHLQMEKATLKRLDDFRFKHRFESGQRLTGGCWIGRSTRSRYRRRGARLP